MLVTGFSKSFVNKLLDNGHLPVDRVQSARSWSLMVISCAQHHGEMGQHCLHGPRNWCQGPKSAIKPSLLDTLPASVSSAQIKSLGMITDCFDSHIGAAVMVCNYHTCALRYVRKHLTTETAQTIACSVISSQVDYCNSLLYGAPVAVIEKLQRAQNNVAQVICQQRY